MSHLGGVQDEYKICLCCFESVEGSKLVDLGSKGDLLGMSDFKALFRKAQASRGVVSSKQQIKKLKSQRTAKHATKIGIPDEKDPTQRLEVLHAEIQADSSSHELIGSLNKGSNANVGCYEESIGKVPVWVANGAVVP